MHALFILYLQNDIENSAGEKMTHSLNYNSN